MSVIHMARAATRQRGYEELLELVNGEDVGRPRADILLRHTTAIVMSPGPIDYWDGMISIREHDPKIFDYTAKWAQEDDVGYTTLTTRIYELLTMGRWLASHMHFEGDTSQGPYFSTTPSFESASIEDALVVAWKQSNNGSSFVAMSRPMPHLWDHNDAQGSYPEFAWLEDGQVKESNYAPS